MKKMIIVSALISAALLVGFIIFRKSSSEMLDDIEFFQQNKLEDSFLFFDVRRTRISMYNKAEKVILDRNQKKTKIEAESYFGYYFSPTLSSYFSYWTDLTGRQGLYALDGNEIEVLFENSDIAYYPLYYRDGRLLISIENDGRESRGRLISYDCNNQSREDVLISEAGNILNAVMCDNQIYYTCYDLASDTYFLYEYSEVLKETPVCVKQGLNSPLLFEYDGTPVYDDAGMLRFGEIEIETENADGAVYQFQNLLLHFTDGSLSQCLIYRLEDEALLQTIDYAAGFLAEENRITIVAYSGEIAEINAI